VLWIGSIIAIGVLIVVHEGGHFIVARLCKMRVDKFSIGFGPALWSWRRGGTQFQIAPIPFGGYVQINGMLVAEEVEADDPHSYPNRPVWQRFLTIFAGPATNYLFAIFLAFVLYVLAGLPTGTSWYEVRKTDDQFDAHGKLLPGDRLLTVNGQPLYRDYGGVAQPGISEVVQANKDALLRITVLRNGVETAPIEVAARPSPDEKLEDGSPRYLLGIELSFYQERVSAGLLTSVGHAVWYPIDQTRVIVGGLYKVLRGEEKGELTGPVGITTVIKESIKAGWITVVELLMLLNVFLGLFNLFPLPALDGGRLVFLTYEMATRKRANPRVEATVHMIGIMALLLVMVLVTYKDITRLL
jgi:regulator of sigma E protease